ncbi:MAG: hypothetical protein AAF703_19795 [Cyanobacteria bacterium P01_D01_bin.105]
MVTSPLLMTGAAQPAAAYPTAVYPTEQLPYGTNCNADTYEATQLSNQGRPQSVDAIAHPTGAVSRAIVTSEQELSQFLSDRLSALSGERLHTAVRQLILSNPYMNGYDAVGSDAIDSDAIDSEQAESNCIALGNRKLLGDLEILIAQAGDPLPILGPVNSTTINDATSESASEQPASAPARKPVTSPTAAPLPIPASTPLPPDVPAASVSPSRPSLSIDPTNVTPTGVEPIPFDGAPISTLSSRPDGNYRYVAGDVEDFMLTDTELQQRNGAVAVLRKEGNRVVGTLMPQFGEPGMCITGIVSGDSISGTLYPRSTDGKLPVDAISEALRLQPTRAIGEEPTAVSAVLDLSGFSMINAGTTPPPKSCL